MKIGTYNLEFLFDIGTRLFSGEEYNFPREFVEKRFSYFAEQFDILDVDILFLQELGDESALIKVLKQTKNNYSYFTGKTDKYGVVNAVIYKSDLDCICTSIPTNTSLPVFNTEDEDVIGKRIWSRRDYVKLETKYQDKKITLIGIHMKSNFLMYENGESYPPENPTQIDTADGIIRSEMFKLNQAKKVRELVDQEFKKDEEAQIIVLGDFNASQKSKVFSIVRGYMKKTNDALIPILENLPLNKRYSIIGHDYNALIDHVLVSKSLEENIQNIEIHNEHITNHSGNPDYPYIIESDHAPVIFNVK